jgi:hypothetical protein
MNDISSVIRAEAIKREAAAITWLSAVKRLWLWLITKTRNLAAVNYPRVEAGKNTSNAILAGRKGNSVVSDETVI